MTTFQTITNNLQHSFVQRASAETTHFEKNYALWKNISMFVKFGTKSMHFDFFFSDCVFFFSFINIFLDREGEWKAQEFWYRSEFDITQSLIFKWDSILESLSIRGSRKVMMDATPLDSQKIKKNVMKQGNNIITESWNGMKKERAVNSVINIGL